MRLLVLKDLQELAQEVRHLLFAKLRAVEVVVGESAHVLGLGQ